MRSPLPSVGANPMNAQPWLVITPRGIRFARVFCRTWGVLLTAGLALSWVGQWLMGFHADIYYRVFPDVIMSTTDDFPDWERHCWHALGVGLLALWLGAYLLARRRRRFVWLVVAYAAFPLVVTFALSTWFRLLEGRWADDTVFDTSTWGFTLLAYGAGYLLAAPWGLTPNADDEPTDAGDPPVARTGP